MAGDPDARLAALLALFGPEARKADPWPIHWMSGGDAGPDYCLPCCEKAVEDARTSGEHPDAEVDGGWDDKRESDGPSSCEGCGRLLGYALNNCGISDEIYHWSSVDNTATITPDDAYHLEELIFSALNFGSSEEKKDVVQIGERMKFMLPGASTPAPSQQSEVRS
jgi:hypothetical protein